MKDSPHELANFTSGEHEVEESLNSTLSETDKVLSPRLTIPLQVV
jgi:hypothetical protein